MATKEIEITLNGIQEQVPENLTIAALIAHVQEGDVHLIVEHNGRFVYPRLYDTTSVAEGDRIEFINPNVGG